MALGAAARRTAASRSSSAKSATSSAGEANRCMLITAGNGGSRAPALFAYDGARLVPLLDRLRRPRRADRLGRARRVLDDLRPAARPGNRSKPRPSASGSPSATSRTARWSPPTASRSASQGSYLPMNAAACAGPSDCWFAGERLPGDASTRAPSTCTGTAARCDRSRRSANRRANCSTRAGRWLASPVHQGSFYESGAGRRRRLAVAGEESGTVVSPPDRRRRRDTLPAAVPGRAACIRRRAAEASELEGFQLSDDGQRLWAIAGAVGTARRR